LFTIVIFPGGLLDLNVGDKKRTQNSIDIIPHFAKMQSVRILKVSSEILSVSGRFYGKKRPEDNP
jgi:hypothetical protein